MKNLAPLSNLFLITSISILSVFLFSCKKDDNCNGNNVFNQVDTVYDIKDGLIAYYNFNGGNLNDSSGFQNNITENYATSTSDRFGRLNNAYYFNGSTSYMRVPNTQSLTPLNMTISAIFRIDGFYNGLCHGNEVLSKGYPDGVAGNYLMRFTDFPNSCSGPYNFNNVSLLTGLQGAVANSDTVILRSGVWYNCVYTFDGLKSRIYINGILKKEINTSVSYASNTYDLFIGRNGSSQYPYYFKGAIDEIRIYNRALSANAVNQLYNSTE